MAALYTDSRRSRSAFTLVELLIVMTIMTILMGLVVGLSTFASRKAAVSRAAAEVQRLAGAIEDYKIDYNTYPDEEPNAYPWEFNMMSEAEFQVLTNYDPDVVFEDPWGRGYKLRVESKHQFRVWSGGVDVTDDVDDIDSGKGF